MRHTFSRNFLSGYIYIYNIAEALLVLFFTFKATKWIPEKEAEWSLCISVIDRAVFKLIFILAGSGTILYFDAVCDGSPVTNYTKKKFNNQV